MTSFDHTILANLVENEQYTRKVIPFLKAEYFQNTNDQLLYRLIAEYFVKYNVVPSKEALQIDLSNVNTLEQDQVDKTNTLITDLVIDPKTDLNWLVDRTEIFCQEQALYNALFASMKIVDGSDKKTPKNTIPKILTDALSISFDSRLGHDYFKDWEKQYEYYHHQAHKIPFDIDWLNTITKGGVEEKTLNLIIGGTGVGKTLFLCHTAAAYLSAGMNILYLTLEISEEKIRERIDCNLLNISLDDIRAVAKDSYESKIEKLKQHIPGRMMIREYGPSTVGVIHFRHLLDELKIKNNFIPDVIFVDSLNLCISSRFKANQVQDMYQHGKNIAEELRGLAIERMIPLWSAVQFNREGFMSSDPTMGNTGESFAIPQTTDLFLGLTTSESLAALNQIMIKQLKNRYRDESINRKFVVGVDKNKMRLYNTEQSSQEDIIDNKEDVIIDKRGSKIDKLFKDLV